MASINESDWARIQGLVGVVVPPAWMVLANALKSFALTIPGCIVPVLPL